MTNNDQLIHDLRCCSGCGGCRDCSRDENCGICIGKLQKDAADALEQLQAELDKLKEQMRWRDASKELPNAKGRYTCIVTNSLSRPSRLWVERLCYRPYWGWVVDRSKNVLSWRTLLELPEEVENA